MEFLYNKIKSQYLILSGFFYSKGKYYRLLVYSFPSEIERLNGEIRRRIKVVSSFPDEDSAMKIFYLKSIEFNSKHAFRKMNGYYKCNDEIKEMFNERYPL